MHTPLCSALVFIYIVIVMDEIRFQRFLLQIKEGGKPGIVGESISREQAIQIKEAIDEQRKRWEDYWRFSIETRLEL